MGATLYRCITGELPPDSITRIYHDTIKKPSELGISSPAGMEAAMMKAMAVKAEDRFSSMEDFLQAVTGRNSGAASPNIGNLRKRPEPGIVGTQTKFPKKSLVLKMTVLIICAVLTGMGVWKLLLGSSDQPDRKPSELPAWTREQSESAPEQRESEQSPLTDYSNEHLNLSMKIPDDFKETDPGSAVFISSDESCSLQIGFYTYWSGFPVYYLADVESNAEKYVRHFVEILESTDITDYKILSKDYCKIGEQNSYQIQFEATESGGSTMAFLAAFIDGQNGFGCYNVIASYPRENKSVEEKLLSSLGSFQCLGPAETDYKLLCDENLSFQFMYAEKEPALDFKMEDDILTATSMEGIDYVILTVGVVPLAGMETANEVLGQVTEGLEEMYPGIGQLGEQKTQESGGMEWAVRNYVNDSEGIAVYMSYSVSIWQDQAYLIIFTSSQEAQLGDNGLKTDIMGSIRPAA